MSLSTSLAVTLHDPVGRIATGIERAGPLLRQAFAGVAVNATNRTTPEVLDACSRHLGAEVRTHEPGPAAVGLARRDAVGMAHRLGADQVLYSDADHIVRWAEANFGELLTALTLPSEAFVVIGRSPTAFEQSPTRLRETERLVNYVYQLMRPGRAWDLMFAIRRLSAEAAETLVSECDENTIANDVVWPLFIEQRGYAVGYFAADGLTYRTIQDFDAATDELDDDPGQWIQRISTAAEHVGRMRAFLDPPR